MATYRDLGRKVGNLALHMDQADPWGVCFTKADAASVADRFSTLAALAQGDRRDWFAVELLKAWLGEEAHLLVQAALDRIARASDTAPVEARLAAKVSAYLQWYAQALSERPERKGDPLSDDEIPF